MTSISAQSMIPDRPQSSYLYTTHLRHICCGAPGSTSASRWHAPRLSQLANRLHEHPSPAVSSGTSPAHAHIPAADSSDGAGTAEEDAGGRDDSAIGAAQRQAHEAGPLCVLLGLLSQQPRASQICLSWNMHRGKLQLDRLRQPVWGILFECPVPGTNQWPIPTMLTPRSASQHKH